MEVERSASLELAEQTQHLQVQPHERDDEREGGEPLHALRQTLLRASFDEVEIERQVHRGQAGGEDTEQDAETAGRVQETDRTGTGEQTDDERDEVEEHQAEGRG